MNMVGFPLQRSGSSVEPAHQGSEFSRRLLPLAGGAPGHTPRSPRKQAIRRAVRRRDPIVRHSDDTFATISPGRSTIEPDGNRPSGLASSHGGSAAKPKPFGRLHAVRLSPLDMGHVNDDRRDGHLTPISAASCIAIAPSQRKPFPGVEPSVIIESGPQRSQPMLLRSEPPTVGELCDRAIESQPALPTTTG
jgi:hypothetical protein